MADEVASTDTGDTLLTGGAEDVSADTSAEVSAVETPANASSEDKSAAEDATDGEQREPDKGEGDKEPDKGEGDKEPEGAPESYADFAAPEGVELNAEALASFKDAAKADNLSQEAAQRYVDMAAQLVRQQHQKLADDILATRESWVTASKADKEFGGDKLDASLATAKRGLETYGSPELSKLLAETGLGDHPEIIRAFAKVGATVSEDKLVDGHKPTRNPATLAERLYPNQNA